MIKNMIKRKVKNEISQNRKKIAIYTGVSVASIAGSYFSYKVIKKIKNKHRDEIQYLDCKKDEENSLRDESEYNELKEKVDEFNSRRICCENCEDSSPEDIKKHIDSIKDYKKNVEINEYEIEKYDNYEDNMQK